MPAIKKNLLLFAIILGALTAYYAPYLKGEWAFYITDFTLYFEPATRFIQEAFSQNRLPLWNPYVYCGMAQIAVPSPGMFYPFTWLHTYMPYSKVIAVALIFHQFVCALGGFLLVSSFGWGFLAALCTAIILALNHYIFSLQSNYTLIYAASWVPLLLWAIYRIDNPPLTNWQRFFSTNNWCIYLVAVLSASMLITAGRPEIFAPACLLAGLFTIYVTWIQVRSQINSLPQSKATIYYLLCIGAKLSPFIFAILISLPTLLPALEWMSLSPRATGLKAGEALTWSANWYDLLSFYLEYPLGDLSLGDSKFLALVSPRFRYLQYIASSFIGPVALTLALWGFTDKSWRERKPLLAILLVILILALGSNTPIAPYLVNTVPAFGVLRYPVKLLFFIVIILAIAAGRGASLAFRSRPSSLSEMLVIGFWLANFLLANIVMLPILKDWVIMPFKEWVIALAYVWQGTSSIEASELLYAGIYLIAQAIFKASLVGGAICLVAYLSWRNKLNRQLFALILVIALFVTLYFPAVAYLRHGTESEFYEHPIVVSQTIRDLAGTRENVSAGSYNRFLCLVLDKPTYPAAWIAGKKGEAYAASYHQYYRQVLMHNTNIDAKLPSSFGYTMAEIADYRNWFYTCFFNSSQSFNSLQAAANGEKPANQDAPTDIEMGRFCRLTSTKYVSTQAYGLAAAKRRIYEVPSLHPRDFKLIQENPDLNYRLYSTIDPYPRAYLTTNWQIAQPKKIEQILNSHSTTDFDRQNSGQADYFTLVEPLPTSNLPPQKEQAPDKNETPSPPVIFLQDKPEHIVLSATATANCLLVLCDQYYPGWKAKVDGAPADIIQANGFMRAIYLKPGIHKIEFEFDPEPLKIGFILCFLSLIALAITSLAVFIRSKGNPSMKRL